MSFGNPQQVPAAFGLITIMSTESPNPEHQRNSEYQELYSERLDAMFGLYDQYDIDARLIGSLGRSAALGQPVTNFTGEYGGPKDVDIIILPRQGQDSALIDRVTQEATETMLPIAVDEHYKGQVVLTDQGAQIKYKGLVKDVDPRVFERREANFLDTRVPTLDPNTLFHLTILHGALRPKDLQNLGRFLQNMPDTSEMLPEELFAPFDELGSEIKSTHRKDLTLGRLRWNYHTRTPVPVRKALSKVTEPVWHKLRKD